MDFAKGTFTPHSKLKSLHIYLCHVMWIKAPEFLRAYKEETEGRS